MAFRLDPADFSGQKLRTGIVRSLCETRDLLERQPQGLSSAVHEARKTFKRLRALYRLVAHENEQLLEHENARLRDTARLLAECREAAALTETMQWLAAQTRKADESALLARTLTALEKRRDATSGDAQTSARIAEVMAACDAAMAGASDLDLPSGRKKMAHLLRNGWFHGLQHARRVLSPLTVDAHAEDFHDLRKSVQTLHAFHGLLRPLWPLAFTARQESLGELADTLGRERDLFLLLALMEREPAHFGAPIEQVIQQRIIARRREALRLSALQQAARLFDTDPLADAERIAILWQALAK